LAPSWINRENTKKQKFKSDRRCVNTRKGTAQRAWVLAPFWREIFGSREEMLKPKPWSENRFSNANRDGDGNGCTYGHSKLHAEADP
jgi:hypothetical protein